MFFLWNLEYLLLNIVYRFLIRKITNCVITQQLHKQLRLFMFEQRFHIQTPIKYIIHIPYVLRVFTVEQIHGQICFKVWFYHRWGDVEKDQCETDHNDNLTGQLTPMAWHFAAQTIHRAEVHSILCLNGERDQQNRMRKSLRGIWLTNENGICLSHFFEISLDLSLLSLSSLSRCKASSNMLHPHMGHGSRVTCEYTEGANGVGTARSALDTIYRTPRNASVLAVCEQAPVH